MNKDDTKNIVFENQEKRIEEYAKDLELSVINDFKLLKKHIEYIFEQEVKNENRNQI